MTTRRQKLVQVLEAAEAAGVTAGDLAARANEFKASGGSGIEAFLDAQVEAFSPDEESNDTDGLTRRAAIEEYLRKSLSIVESHKGEGIAGLFTTLDQVV